MPVKFLRQRAAPIAHDRIGGGHHTAFFEASDECDVLRHSKNLLPSRSAIGVSAEPVCQAT